MVPFIWALWTFVPLGFWACLFLFHHAIGFVKVLPGINRIFIGTKSCRFGGLVPIMCLQQSPHWFWVFLDYGARGFFLLVGTFGVAMHVIDWEYRHPMLSTHRMYARKVLALWTMMVCLLPVWFGDLFRPAEVVLSYVALGATLELHNKVLVATALVMSWLTDVPLVLYHMVLMMSYKAVVIKQFDRYSEAYSEERVVIPEWLKEFFGEFRVSDLTAVKLKVLVSTTTQDAHWEQVAVWAYGGDKLAYFMNAIMLENLSIKVSQVHGYGHNLDNTCLSNAMRFFVPEWWANQPKSMHGKAAATVLEAAYFLIMVDGKSFVRGDAVQLHTCYLHALERANSFSRENDNRKSKSEEDKDSIGGSEFMECEQAKEEEFW
jgi:hypothetical protein